MDTKKEQNDELQYSCNICDYKCSKKCNLKRHMTNGKHETNDIREDTNNYTCMCGKTYKYSQGLSKHKIKCTYTDKDKLIVMLVKQNADLMKEMMGVIKNGTNNTINSHNKTFNLQFFLNETCKDAMNIMDFVDSVKLQLSDLENVGKNGFVEGISNIIVNKLNLLEENKRPIHCTDAKREVLYVRDENKWEKEPENKPKIRRVIKKVVNQNIKLFPAFEEKYPGCRSSESNSSDQYLKIMFESMGGEGDNDVEKEDTIITKISKKIVIDKR